MNAPAKAFIVEIVACRVIGVKPLIKILTLCWHTHDDNMIICYIIHLLLKNIK